MSMRDWVDQELGNIEKAELLRSTQALEPLSAVEARLEGDRLVLFSGNDYLGLSSHPEVVSRSLELMRRSGMGLRGASLLCGYTRLHQSLEERLAHLKQTQAALLFPTGYMANLGVLQAFGGADAEIFSDRLNHASIIDGCRLARSTVCVYEHGDVDHLERLMRCSSAARKIVVTEALFSMDGDLAPLQEIVSIKNRYGGFLVVDEAHSTLIFGDNGSGLANELGIQDQVDVQMGTLSKAFGALGGYLAVSHGVRSLLVNRARSFIFTTALPVPVVAASLAALETAEQYPDLRSRLWDRVSQLHSLLAEGGFPAISATAGREATLSPIRPVIVGSERPALKLAKGLLQRGFHVPAIRPPTVPTGTSRLRISLSAAHTSLQIEGLVRALQDVAEKPGIANGLLIPPR